MSPLNGGSRVLVTGRNRSGSWLVRGEQLGRAIGAAVELNASKVRGYDLAILVKRPRIDLLSRLRVAGVPIVWDVVDAWPQPEGNQWGRDECMNWLRNEFAEIAPVGVVVSTDAMARDCGELGVPVLTLRHHARPGQRVNPVRTLVQTVGYEGAEHYLGRWREPLELACAQRGWRFEVNPTSLADLDIVVALRSPRGYAAKHWKSNVKLANAQDSGTPCVLNRESGYEETARGGVYWVDEPEDLSPAFDTLADVEQRRSLSRQLRESRINLEDVAGRYKQWLHQLKF